MIGGYDDLKKFAAALGVSVKDLLALAPINDPFYAEVPHREQAGQWFAEIWEQFGFSDGVHLRRIHYRLIAEPVPKPDGETYANNANDWRFLGTASLAARYLHLVPVDAFVDRRNPEPYLNAPYDGLSFPPSIDTANSSPEIGAFFTPSGPCLDLSYFNARQEYVVEVWIEKSTMNDVLEPLSRRLGFNLVTGVGEMSEVAARNVVGRAADPSRLSLSTAAQNLDNVWQ